MRYTLTADQTQFIAGYTFRQGVEWYDVELEVVDHIAAWVEDKISTKGLSFDEVYEEMKITFSQKELMQIVESKKKSISRRMSGVIGKEFISFFTVPRIFLTILLAVATIVIPQWLTLSEMPYFLMSFSLLFTFTVVYPQGKKFRQIKGVNGLKKVRLLSLAVRSPYERIIPRVVPILAGLNLLRILSYSKPLIYNRSKEEIILQSFTGLLLVLYLFTYCVIVVRHRILIQMVKEYPSAFIE